MDARASKQYRAALDALFEKGEVGKLAEKLTPNGPRARSARSRARRHRPSRRPAGDERRRLVDGRRALGRGAVAARASARQKAPPPRRRCRRRRKTRRAVLRKKVLEALGRDEISRAVDRYVKAHGWPNDFEILEQALEHTKPDRQTEAMTALEKLLEREKPKRSRTLAGKLRFIEETSDGDLRDQAARIRAKL